jgi:hypothetical protein
LDNDLVEKPSVPAAMKKNTGFVVGAQAEQCSAIYTP